MTLCIAAVAHEGDDGDYLGGDRIVLSFDSKIGTERASAEIAFKLDWVTPGWCALYAGEVATAKELLGIYQEQTTCRPLDGLTTAQILEEFRKPPRILKDSKRRMAEAHIQAALGISYKEFLPTAKSRLAATSTVNFSVRFPAWKFPVI